ncbi:proteasome inhibitor PI31 subunit [Bombus vosnesenskii]|uniref:Proteasome inhibitor PI31 subunit n=3 Tax=Pyrobombus TaxID=144703 RepID=A0A6J3KCG6_9HYME|nr:proteasome inhibitor PI31 subunit [Bombus impatiens]XP_033194331.1 proteasome inhibitor PI31 subunit [Bombus vancouverensis nearcticus]XP_033307790.1 proteasome inhibitor PI31 subunit [Bombus bifarius]XP_033350146.1 proteasome inhibitor PI31 subunit [Bombus vosnesenskii]
MGDTRNVFGFELVQEIYNNQITKKEDVLILFVHWYLIKYGFRCIGIGDSKAFEPTEKGSQLLPEGWNTRPNYALRYIKDSKLFIFHGIKSDEDLLINLLKVDDQNVSNVQFPINQTVNELHGDLESVIPSYQNVINVIQEDLIHALIPGNMVVNSTQTSFTNDQSRDNPLRVGESTRPSSASYPWNRDADPLRVGAADLNPFAQGSGMIFDPFSSQRNRMNPSRPGLGVPGRLPPGAVPPFAKFDPFGPPDINQPRPRRDPDNDHLPPPGYDDMFM